MADRTVGLVGLGVMGANLARNIESRGHEVCVYNRTTETMRRFLREHAEGHRFRGMETSRSSPQLSPAHARSS